MRVSSKQKQEKHDLLMFTYLEYRKQIGVDRDIEKMITGYGKYTCKQFEQKIKEMKDRLEKLKN